MGPFHFDDFEIRDGKLNYRDKTVPLTNKRKELRSVGVIAEILGKEGLRDFGFDITVEGKETARQAIMLNRVEDELPSASDVAKEDDIELQEVTENAAKSTRDLIVFLVCLSMFVIIHFL